MYDETAQSMMYQGLNIEQYLKLTGTTKEQLLELAKGYKTDYGRYLEFIASV